MSKTVENATSRREFLRSTGRVAAASALAGMIVPHVHAAEDNTIRVALVGCGDRGTGAAADALTTASGPIKLVAMADLFEKRLNSSLSKLQVRFGGRVEVSEDRRFVGFDAYRKAMDCLRPGDVALFATPPAFRWVHFRYAVEKGLNVFMEKPTTVDGPSARKMLALAEESEKKNLKVGVGLMCRHAKDHIGLCNRIRDGELGEILALRAYRLHGPIAYFFSEPKPEGISELLYQVQRFHSFLWVSGGLYNDAYVHNVDECCWMKGAWPVEAQALGGRHFRGNWIDQNFDNYSVEYTFADGTKFFLYGRVIDGCHDDHSSWAHGTKGLALISTGGHSSDKCRIFKGQTADNQQIAWKYPGPASKHYQLEWDELIEAIRQDKPYNEAKRGAEASLVCSLGRMAAHTGRVVTYDEILNCEHEFAPDIDKLTMDSPAPVLTGPDGKYPIPQPGVTTKREY